MLKKTKKTKTRATKTIAQETKKSLKTKKDTKKIVLKKKTKKIKLVVKKRDGSTEPQSPLKLTSAIRRAMIAAQEGTQSDAEMISKKVVVKLKKQVKENPSITLFVESIQDMVEKELMENGFSQAAKSYILYRDNRAKARGIRGDVPQKVRDLTKESSQYFKNQLAEYVYYTTYSKWIPEEGRRETWVETVSRYIDFMRENMKDKIEESEYKEIREYMLSMKVLGSMRLLWSSGAAARATNVAGYNCAFIAPTEWRDFGEIAYVLMCGTGMGYSVEEQNVQKLPFIEYQTGEKVATHVVKDSKEGWSDAIILGLETWASGKDIEFDFREVRAEGARLKTMGGRASGPKPLLNFLAFAKEKMFSRQGRRLSTINVHDLVCKIGEIVVMGGVRRSALISLSDLDDKLMQEAKSGQFYITNPERSMANNSAVYNEKPTTEQFLDEWFSLVKGRSGERGIYNRGGLKKQMPARRWKKFEADHQKSGVNPCGEINLKSKQFCNLSEVVAEVNDTEDTLMEKVRIATILGTYQSSLTDFPYLSKEWKKNCEEERLLGVSITGQWDCPALRDPLVMRKLKEVAVDTNRKYAKRFGIEESTSITCVKPSGNGSQLFDSASGCHPRYAKYYIRRVRIESHNPVFHMLKDLGVPHHPEVGQSKTSASTYVLEFPIKAPQGAITRHDIDAMEHLAYWKMLKENYTEHNPSVTIQVADDEWLKVGNWVYENWDLVGGLSFLPKNDTVYKMAPYEEITKAQYEEMNKNFPNIDFSKIVLYEYDDTTTGSKELACSSGTCEVDVSLDSLVEADE